MPNRIIILSVEADKHDSLVEALGKREYIRVISMDRHSRRHMTECPCCSRRLSKESSFTISDNMITYLISVVEKMTVTKTVVLVNKDNPITALSPIEHVRCVEVDPMIISRAEALGLLKTFIDGCRLTHYVSTTGLEFLSGEKPAAPSTVFVLDGEIVERSGELLIENVKFKDEIQKGTITRNAAKAVKSLPEYVMNFVVNGQMSLI